MSGGLDGVVAADTVLSRTDRDDGMVWVRGRALPSLEGFEATVALLWEGFSGEGLTAGDVRAALGAARVSAFARLEPASGRSLFEGVRMGLAAMPDTASGFDLGGALPVIAAALLRAAEGKVPVAPDPSLSTAADLLRMYHGAPAPAASAAALDVYFTVMAESGLSNSAFAARVIASTRAPLAAAVLGAWCSFTGALHGGAPGPTLDMLDAAEAAPDLDAWIEARLRSGERLMGFGHRVFHGNDPRAEAMRAAMSGMGRLAFAARLEERVAAVVERVRPGRPLPPNVEIVASLLLDAVGFPRAGFTPVFAVGRCAGWVAHALEQAKTGRMIRPVSRYVGGL